MADRLSCVPIVIDQTAHWPEWEAAIDMLPPPSLPPPPSSPPRRYQPNETLEDEMAITATSGMKMQMDLIDFDRHRRLPERRRRSHFAMEPG